MSDFRIVNPIAGLPAITQTDSAPATALGYEVDAVDIRAATSGGGGFGRFQYCRGSNVASIGQWVHIFNGSAVILASANATRNNAIGVAPSVLSATNVYGWVQVVGRVDYVRGTNTSWAAGAVPYIGGTVGQLVSNSVAGQRVQGAYIPADMSNTGLGSVASQTWDINRPFIAGVTALL